jgi:uncharacterized protein (TIGR02453 family)
MSSYSEQTFKFFRGIKKNQNKIWYEKNKALYQDVFVRPSLDLVESLSETPEFRVLGLKSCGKSSVFRLHRDVRFSHNKSPYKHYNGLVMSRSGSKKDAGVFYLHVEPANCFVAFGFWQPDPKLLSAFRNWIVAHPKEYLENVETKLHLRKIEFDNSDSLKKLPLGYREESNEKIFEALKRRHFVVSERLSDKDMLSPRFKTKLRAFAKRAAPLMLWGWSVESSLDSELTGLRSL